MKFIFLFILFINSIFCASWDIRIGQDFNDLHQNYFSDKNYEEIDKLQISLAFGYSPKQIEKVKFNFLKVFPNLKALKIYWFDFKLIEEVEFAGNLQLLWLEHNNIKFLQINLTKNLKNLEVLRLGFNNIESLPEKLLLNNKKLREFSIQHNKIKEIPQNFFKGLTELEIVNFWQNKIEFLSSDLFKDNKKLKNIYFEDNEIQQIHPSTFLGLRFAAIWIWGNPCVINEDYESYSNIENCFAEWCQSNKLVTDNTV